jgi:general secretion pathway protein D
MQIVDNLDRKSFEGTLTLVNLQHASAETVTQKLTQLLGTQKKQAVQTGEISFVPDERTNSVIVLADRKNTRRIKRMLQQLDQPTPENLSNIQVVPLENAKAEDLAQVLSNIAGKGGSEKGAKAISRDVSIVADKPSNSLVVVAEPKEFQKIMPIIEKLDQARKQVFVEAAIIEISSDTTFNLGINWQGGTDFGGSDVDGFLFGTSNGLVGSSAEDVTGRLSGSGLSLGVLSFPFTYRGEEFFSLGGFISASQQDNNVHIISTPQLMTMENEEATVTIAENRPFVTSREVSGDTDREFNNIEYKDVGVTLKVTPLINNKGWIKMGLYQEVSRIDPNVEFDTETPITRKRTAETTVAVKDGQTVVIAGLMENKKSDNESQVPGLGDVPLFGRLFKTTSKEERKTNLMVFITPRIVQDPADAERIAYNKSKLLNKLRFDIDGQVQPILEDFIPYPPMR